MKIKRLFLPVAAIGIVVFMLVAWLAAIDIKYTELGSAKHKWNLRAKKFVINTLDIFVKDKATILDKAYKYPNLEDDRFEAIRKDSTFSFFFESNKSFSDIINLMDWLRDQKEYGNEDFYHFNVLDMLKDDDWSCGESSIAMIQVLQAAGIQARTISLVDTTHRGHTSIEFWSNEFNKWVHIDPTYNIYYTNDSIPLNSLDLHRGGDYKIIRLESNNSYWRQDSSDLVQRFLKVGFSVGFWAHRITDRNISKIHPRRHSINCTIYTGDYELAKYYYNHSNCTDVEKLYGSPNN